MVKHIPFTSILSCGVWHKGANTLSTLDEAVAALGSDYLIINGGFFNPNGSPSSAYSIGGIDYHTGGSQFGYAFTSNGAVRWSYLRNGANDFIGAYPMFMTNSVPVGKDDGGRTSRTVLGDTDDGVYIESSMTSTISEALNRALQAGCKNAINLDGGGSSQYHLPDGANYYGTDPKRKVLNWVYFKLKQEKKMPKVYLSPSNQTANATLISGKSECDIMNELADLLVPILEASGIAVMRADKLERVSDRVTASNNYKPDLDLQLHSNAGGGTGTETLICARGGQAEKCAEIVQSELVNATGLVNRGIKVQNDYELNNTKSPAILIENFFHDNASDIKYWQNNKSIFAKAICKGVCSWMGIPFIDTLIQEPRYITIEELRAMGYDGIKFY